MAVQRFRQPTLSEGDDRKGSARCFHASGTAFFSSLCAAFIPQSDVGLNDPVARAPVTPQILSASNIVKVGSMARNKRQRSYTDDLRLSRRAKPPHDESVTVFGVRSRHALQKPRGGAWQLSGRAGFARLLTPEKAFPPATSAKAHSAFRSSWLLKKSVIRRTYSSGRVKLSSPCFSPGAM